jgi:hypothetical protein
MSGEMRIVRKKQKPRAGTQGFETRRPEKARPIPISPETIVEST